MDKIPSRRDLPASERLQESRANATPLGFCMRLLNAKRNTTRLGSDPGWQARERSHVDAKRVGRRPRDQSVQKYDIHVLANGHVHVA